MRKSTIFISSILTTFALVILYEVASAYQGNVNKTIPNIPTATDVPVVDTVDPLPTPNLVTPVQAAQLAVKVIGHDGLLSAESATINGLNAYLITFTNKDIVYVGLDGQILSVQVAPVVVNVQVPVQSRNKNKNNNNNTRPPTTNTEPHDD